MEPRLANSLVPACVILDASVGGDVCAVVRMASRLCAYVILGESCGHENEVPASIVTAGEQAAARAPSEPEMPDPVLMSWCDDTVKPYWMGRRAEVYYDEYCPIVYTCMC